MSPLMISGMENATATFYHSVETGTPDDAYGGTTTTTEWQPIHEDIDVRYVPGGLTSAGLRRSAGGSDVTIEDALYVPPAVALDVVEGSPVDVTYYGEVHNWRVSNVALRSMDGETGYAELTVEDFEDADE